MKKEIHRGIAWAIPDSMKTIHDFSSCAEEWIHEVSVSSWKELEVQTAYLCVCPKYACGFIEILLSVGEMDWEDFLELYQKGPIPPLHITTSRNTRTLIHKSKPFSKDLAKTVPSWVQLTVSPKKEEYLLKTILPDLLEGLGEEKVSETLQMLQHGVELFYKSVGFVKKDNDTYDSKWWFFSKEMFLGEEEIPTEDITSGPDLERIIKVEEQTPLDIRWLIIKEYIDRVKEKIQDANKNYGKAGIVRYSIEKELLPVLEAFYSIIYDLHPKTTPSKYI